MSTNTTSVWRKKLKELEIVVVIPTYNNGKTLAAVIEEVCRYADDIIVVNDGSTDDTANILEQYPHYQRKSFSDRHTTSYGS